jgi:hypothetical protein
LYVKITNNEKITCDEIQSLVSRILANWLEFGTIQPDSGRTSRIPTKGRHLVTGIRLQCQTSSDHLFILINKLFVVALITCLSESGGSRRCRHSAIGYQNLGTFGCRFGLPTNSNAQQWWIPTNVPTRMESFNPENDL